MAFFSRLHATAGVQKIHHEREGIRFSYFLVWREELQLLKTGIPWMSLGLRLHAPNTRGLGSIPGQETRFHMLQLR